jgi:hypothetical protein
LIPSTDLNSTFFPNPEIQSTRHLTPKFQIPVRIVPEIGSAVPVSINQRDLTAVRINAELPLKGLLSQSPLIIYNLTLAFQIPSRVSNKDVPYG